MAIIFGLLLFWFGMDLYAPRLVDIRHFDPNEVARLETAMWRSYYSKERLQLFVQLAKLMRTQYQFPLLRSHTAAYQAAKAAFVFKEGHQRRDYEKALPSLIKFYAAIYNVSNSRFEIDKAARLELEWWIIHRERAKHSSRDLERALAELPAEIYQVPAEKLRVHAELRAKAMIIRDDRAEAGGLSEADWLEIENSLRDSWQSLYWVINP